MPLSVLIIIWLLIQLPLGIAAGKFVARKRGDESMGVNAHSMGVNAHEKRARVFMVGKDVA
jgi:hypothetical protein